MTTNRVRQILDSKDPFQIIENLGIDYGEIRRTTGITLREIKRQILPEVISCALRGPHFFIYNPQLHSIPGGFERGIQTKGYSISAQVGFDTATLDLIGRSITRPTKPFIGLIQPNSFTTDLSQKTYQAYTFGTNLFRRKDCNIYIFQSQSGNQAPLPGAGFINIGEYEEAIEKDALDNLNRGSFKLHEDFGYRDCRILDELQGKLEQRLSPETFRRVEEDAWVCARDETFHISNDEETSEFKNHLFANYLKFLSYHAEMRGAVSGKDMTQYQREIRKITPGKAN